MVAAATAFIDLQALTDNLRVIRSVAPDSSVMAVVKANAYGHGLLAVARAMPGVDAFAVARLGEGLSLRASGITQRIVVLQGFLEAAELESMMQHALEPVIHDPQQVDLLEKLPSGRGLRVWLKLDTGMHRLGVALDDFSAVYARLERCAAVFHPVPVMTHLANADTPEDPWTRQQIEGFHQMAEAAEERSMANSAGILAWDRAHTEWIRPGIALYGVSPFAEQTAADLGLRPVMTLRTRLISVKTLQPGARVGYGGDFVCEHALRMGIAAIGYGDGYPRNMPTGTPILIDGVRVPLIGRVSMDMIAIDLSEYPWIMPGAVVTLWGEGLPVEEIARWAGTIPYTLLCGITRRVLMDMRA